MTLKLVYCKRKINWTTQMSNHNDKLFPFLRGILDDLCLKSFGNSFLLFSLHNFNKEMMNELERYNTFDAGQVSLICMEMLDLTNDS